MLLFFINLQLISKLAYANYYMDGIYCTPEKESMS